MMKNFASILLGTVAQSSLFVAAAEQERAIYENYSFDFSAHERPIAYQAYGNAIELVNKIKLNPDVEGRGGAYKFDNHIEEKEFEI